jgi:N-acetylmuramoyl-L-alanine amidase
MTGINWAKMPVTIVEMGFMSNYDEDMFLTSEDGQDRIVRGLANGVDEYFSQYGKMEAAE